MNTPGERLKRERLRLGLSQAELAEKGGVLRGAQIHYESDARKPDVAYLSRIASAGVDVGYVITGEPREFALQLSRIRYATQTAASVTTSREEAAQLRDSLLAAMESDEASALIANWAKCDPDRRATISRIAQLLAEGADPIESVRNQIQTGEKS